MTKKSIKTKLARQFSGFTAIVMLLMILIVAFFLKNTLTQQLHLSLSSNTYNTLRNIETRIAYLVENVKNFAENHFVINSQIDPDGRTSYLPSLVDGFNARDDIYATTIVNFDGEIIYSSISEPPNYKLALYLRPSIELGKTVLVMSDDFKRIIVIEPIQYYNTPQGAVIVELDLVKVCQRILTDDKTMFYKIMSRGHLIFTQNLQNSKPYISLRRAADQELFNLNKVHVEIAMGISKKIFFAPVISEVYQLAFVGLFCIIFAAFVAFRIGDGVARPILKLYERVAKSETSKYEKCSPIGTDDELEELASAFDDRTKQLLEAQSHLEKRVSDRTVELVNSNTKLRSEIIERRRAEKKLHENAKNLHESKERLDIILNSIGNGVVVIDNDQKAMIVNDKAKHLLGNEIANLDNRSLADLFKYCKNGEKRLLDSLDKNADKIELQVEYPVTRTLLVTGSVFHDLGGQLSGNIFVLTDMTQEREVDKMKTDFVSNVSHELRTPLASIIGFASTILRDKKMGEGTKTEFVNIIYGESKRLSQLIEDILNISRIESGNHSYNFKRMSIAPVIHNVFETFQLEAQKHNLTFSCELDDTLPTIMADEKAIKQVLVNLVGNAIKFSRSGGEVTIIANEDAGQLALAVADNGIGIPQKNIKQIFEKFYRVKHPDLEINGTGLGLSIVKETINSHSGDIRVLSEENKGTRFEILFPGMEDE